MGEWHRRCSSLRQLLSGPRPQTRPVRMQRVWILWPLLPPVVHRRQQDAIRVPDASNDGEEGAGGSTRAEVSWRQVRQDLEARSLLRHADRELHDRLLQRFLCRAQGPSCRDKAVRWQGQLHAAVRGADFGLAARAALATRKLVLARPVPGCSRAPLPCGARRMLRLTLKGLRGW